MAIINSKVKALPGRGLPQRQVHHRHRCRPAGQVVDLLLLPGRLHLRLPDRARRHGRPVPRVPEARRRGLTPVSTDTHFTHKAWARRLRHHQEDRLPDDRRPTGAITRGFDVMIEEEGLALRGTFDRTRKARSRSPRSTTWASAATPASCCARSRPPSTWRATRAKSARQSGRKAKPPWPRRSTWSARSKRPRETPPARPARDSSAKRPAAGPCKWIQFQWENTMLDATIKAQLAAYLERRSAPSNSSPPRRQRQGPGTRALLADIAARCPPRSPAH